MHAIERLKIRYRIFSTAANVSDEAFIFLYLASHDAGFAERARMRVSSQ